jgi:uncharacterized membrane protein
MRKTHFFLIGMLLFSLIAVNIIAPIDADEPRGTRSPDADVKITCPSGNQTGIPTETLSYLFVVNNTGNETDNFTISAESQHDWLSDWSDFPVGPLLSNESTEVTVNITIPMGAAAFLNDSLTFSARSHNEIGFQRDLIVNTTVNEAFILSLDIAGEYSKTSSINPPGELNYTLTLRNKGNDDVTITLNFTASETDWDVSCQYSNWQVTVYKANLTDEGIELVNITVSAPLDVQPGETMDITLWAEKKDEDWYSWQEQTNLTFTTIVQATVGVRFTPEKYIAHIGPGDTLFNFTMENIGNTDVDLDIESENDRILITSLDISRQMLGAGWIPIPNRLRVSTSENAQLGNYTINVSAREHGTSKVIGSMEVYYIIAPILNITNISISDDEPMQYRSTDVIVTIENIGYVHATNVTVKLYDGDKKVGEEQLEFINTSEIEEVKISWSPSDFGNRSIRTSIDVEGIYNFSDFGTDIAEKSESVDVKINWQPYYLAIYIIIVIILGIGTFSAMVSLRYYGGVPHLNHLGEGTEDMGYDDYPDETGSMEGGEEEGPFAPFGASEEKEPEDTDYYDYSSPEERPYPPPPPPPEEAPPERDIPPPLVLSKDNETQRKEDELRDDLRRLEDRINRTKSMGVNTANIDQLLRTAKKSLGEGDLNKTRQYIGYGNERLDNLTSKRDEAENAIREAKELLSSMRGSADLTIVENFLVKADSLFSEGNFREAKNYAIKAKERAMRLQRQEMRL